MQGSTIIWEVSKPYLQVLDLTTGSSNFVILGYCNTCNDFTYYDFTYYDFTYYDFTYYDFTYYDFTYYDFTYYNLTYYDFTYYCVCIYGIPNVTIFYR